MKFAAPVLAALVAIPALTISADVYARGGRDSGGGSRFMVSVDKIAAIAEDPRVWKLVHSPIETVDLVRSKGPASEYRLSTKEVIPVLDSAGRTIEYRKETCIFSATVEYVANPTGAGGKIYVKRLDFRDCPAVRNRARR